MLRRLHLFSATPNCIYNSRARVLYTTMAEPQELSAAITEQTQRLNDLRLSRVQDQAAIDEAKRKLSELKKTLGELKRGAAGPKEDIKKRERLLLKTAKASLIVLIGSSRSNGDGNCRELGTLGPRKWPFVSTLKLWSKSASSAMEGHASIHPYSRGKTSSPINMEKTRSSFST